MMGATSWLYFVPYQVDVKEALQELRKDVFLRNDYYVPITKEKMIESLRDALRDPDRYDPDLLASWRRELERLQSLSEAKQGSIEEAIHELLAVHADSGTHSILDIQSTSADVGFGVAAPLSEQELQNIFGTDQPSRQMIESKSGELQSLRARWEGIYIIVYRDGKPDEIAFAGYSGD